MKLNTFGIVLLLTVWNNSIAFSSVSRFSNDISDRIIAGKPASPGQFPWQVLLIFQPKLLLTTMCGGVIISPEWILTAAHCAKGMIKATYKVKVGSLKLNDYKAKTMRVDKIIPHEDYELGLDGVKNDIALLHLKSSIKLNENIRPISLSNSTPALNTKVTVSGWGVTNPIYRYIPIDKNMEHLNFADLKTVPGQKCVPIPGITIPEGTICTLGERNIILRKSACSGDSGGPLVTGSGDSAVLVGIVSWGDFFCQHSAFMDVAYFRDWIKEKSGV